MPEKRGNSYQYISLAYMLWRTCNWCCIINKSQKNSLTNYLTLQDPDPPYRNRLCEFVEQLESHEYIFDSPLKSICSNVC